MTRIYVGIDIAKNLHYASIMNSFGEILCDPFPFENNKQGFQLLLSKVESYPKESLTFGMESTAHYSNNLSNYLLLNSYNVIIINPLQTSALRKTNMRDAKNDKIDSLLVCTALSMRLKTQITLDDTLIELRDICQEYRDITNKISTSKIQLITHLDKAIPELAKLFKASIHGKSIYALLKDYPLPAKIKEVRIDKLTSILSRNSHGKYSKEKALKLKELCQNTVGIQRDSLGRKIRIAIA